MEFILKYRYKVKKIIPPALLNNALLKMPFLYRTKLVNYETNMGPTELADLREILPEAVKAPGDLIECGSSRCGSAIITALWLRERAVGRRIYACDSFEGFPSAEFLTEKERGLAKPGSDGFTSTSLAYVLRKLKVLGLDRTIIPVQGYFQETLKDLPGPFCYALIDCDLGDSAEYCARALFPKLSPGGWMVFDDYFSQDYKGARRAADRFARDYKPQLELDEPRRAF